MGALLILAVVMLAAGGKTKTARKKEKSLLGRDGAAADAYRARRDAFLQEKTGLSAEAYAPIRNVVENTDVNLAVIDAHSRALKALGIG